MTPDPAEDTTTFADLGLRPELLRALSGLGYEEPTPIQREAIPPLLQGRDLVGQAATGTGKTAAFALPVLERIARQAERGEPMALVLVPTRELAMQVSEAMHRYGRELGARILPIYGGQPIGRQLRALERGVDVVVATPGRAIDHIARQTLGLGSLEVVVLDEADEMLDMGFAEDIEAILRHAPKDRQTVLFRRRCHRGSMGWSVVTCTIRSGFSSGVRRRVRVMARWSVRAPMWFRGPTRRRRSGVCWMWRRRRLHWSFAARGTKLSSSPRP